MPHIIQPEVKQGGNTSTIMNPDGKQTGETLTPKSKRMNKKKPKPVPKTEDDYIRDKLPLDFFTNYLSMGLDAECALKFHIARDNNPGRFTSQKFNQAYYGYTGAKLLPQGKWKNLVSFVKIVCDGVDLAEKLQASKAEAIIFLNIPSYAGGTNVWKNSEKVNSILKMCRY